MFSLTTSTLNAGTNYLARDQCCKVYPLPPNYLHSHNALEQEILKFSRPFVLFDGDSHFFRIDKPLGVRAAKAQNAAKPVIQPSIVNPARIEAFGQPSTHWLRITVDDSPQVFNVRQHVAKNNFRNRSQLENFRHAIFESNW